MAKKERYEELSIKVLELIGEKDNITYLGHCMTRLRFNLKDTSIVDLNEILKIDGVIGAQWSNEQLQIIIGQSVGEAYKLISAKAGLTDDKSLSEKSNDKKEKFSISVIFDGISGCLMPLIPALIGAGMIKVIIILGQMMGFLTTDMPTYTVFRYKACH